MRISTDTETLKKFGFKSEVKQSELADTISKGGKRKNPQSAYQLALRHIKLLESDGLIRLKTTVQSKHGKPSKVYEITPLGLIIILSECEDVYANINLIAQEHSDLFSLVFGKWQFFETQGVKQVVIDNIKLASKTLAQDLSWVMKMRAFERLVELERKRTASRKQTNNVMKELFEQAYGSEATAKLKKLQQIENSFESVIKEISDPKHDFLDIVFAIAPAKGYSIESKSILEFFQALKSDLEIRAYITEELRNLAEEYAGYLKNIDAWRKWWAK